ncbi:hypothetical protein E2C01_003226 [Portunus trituberculatus]|uniref:Uncharacterized protein n=1 Tax=Portunus trituberculatus TaxID=210409 RepID=A0A5B7CM19_PORTR|nr:hypothetical protein [Portunus trituberculatus]
MTTRDPGSPLASNANCTPATWGKRPSSFGMNSVRSQCSGIQQSHIAIAGCQHDVTHKVAQSNLPAMPVHGVGEDATSKRLACFIILHITHQPGEYMRKNPLTNGWSKDVPTEEDEWILISQAPEGCLEPCSSCLGLSSLLLHIVHIIEV